MKLISLLSKQNIQKLKILITKLLKLKKIVFILMGKKQKNIRLSVNIKFWYGRTN